MSPIILNPGVNFRSRSLKSLFPIKLSKDHQVSVETLNKKSFRLCEVRRIAPFHTVTSSKSTKLKAHHHFRLRWSKRTPKKCLSESSPLPHERLGVPCTLGPKRSFARSVLEIDQPPGYPDHGDVFLKLGREKDDDANWEVRYAVECVDSILRSQSEHYGDAGPQDYPCPLVHHIELAKPSTKPQLSVLEHDFRHFYSSLTPFPLDLESTHGARIRDLIAANTWENLFSETANATDATGNMPARSGAGVSSAAGIAVSRQRDHDHPAPTTSEGGCSDHGVGVGAGVDPSEVPRLISLLDPQLLAAVATWDIERLHERASTKSTPREEAVAAVSNFDDDFQSGGTCSVEWRRPKLGETIPAERINLPAPESTGITKHSDNGTVSGESYNGGAVRASKASGAANQKPFSKRERDDEDQGEGKKRKKKDQQPQTPSGPSLKEVETFPCPFEGHGSPARACSTHFPNLSKLKEHLRRVHFQHLQCPHEPCGYCAGSPFEINRHQKQRHLSKLDPIETTDIENLQKHKALKLKRLTWNEISKICFSMDYVRGRLDGTICSDEEDGGDNPEGDSDETDEVTGSTSTDYDEAFLNADEFGEKSGQQRNSATEARTNDSTPDGNLLPKGVGGIIDDNFEKMRQMLTPQIISRLETYSLLGFSIYKEITTIFQELYRIDENYINGSSAPQSNFFNPLNNQQTFMPASLFNSAESSSQNLNTVYPPLPTSSQGPPTDFGAPPMNFNQGNVVPHDPNYSKDAELVLDLVPPPYPGLSSPYSEFTNDDLRPEDLEFFSFGM